MEANKSFYQYYQLLGGVTFGVGELHYLRTGNVLDARIIFPMLISFGFVIGLMMKKQRIEARGEVRSALARRYSHILADYLCVIGVTALFSMLAYMVMNDVHFFEQGWSLTRFSFTVIMNFVLLAGGMVLLSGLAGAERRGA